MPTTTITFRGPVLRKRHFVAVLREAMLDDVVITRSPMTRLDQLAALVAKQGAPVRLAATKGPGDAVVADVASPVDADVLAAAHNVLPDAVEALRLVIEQAARDNARRTTTLVSWRRRAAALAARYA